MSNLFNNLAEEFHKIKCKFGHDNKQCETCENEYKDCDYCRKYANVEINLVEYKFPSITKKPFMKI